MNELTWISERTIREIHRFQLTKYGGLEGVRDENMLSVSMARPQQLFAYGESPTIFDLAAAYAFGFAKNHPFSDGNKRVAFAVAVTFLRVNGYRLEASETDAIEIMLNLASGSVSQDTIALWLEANAIAAN
jgi:death on curing protein